MARVLIVDDDPHLCRVLQLILNRHHVECDSAESGEQALEKLVADPPPGLILLDVMLPGLNGLEVLQRVKADPKVKNTPVIMISTLTDKDDLRRAKDMGAADYLPKPFDMDQLINRVNQALNKTSPPN